MSHEATHVATGAAVLHDADLAARGLRRLRRADHVDLPVSVTASQILARVRKTAPPAQLPGDDASSTRRTQALGASYESAWLACRLLGERYGEKRLIAFYRAADRDGSTVGAVPHAARHRPAGVHPGLAELPAAARRVSVAGWAP